MVPKYTITVIVAATVVVWQEQNEYVKCETHRGFAQKYVIIVLFRWFISLLGIFQYYDREFSGIFFF